MRRLALSLVLVAGAGCGDNQAALDSGGLPIDAPADAMVDGVAPDANPLEPATLFGTGLCVDEACTQISSDVHEYAPQYILYADGATKRRWIYLPPGTQIDTSDMNHWVFPVGTKIWKEFTRDGVRVETRYIAKVADGEALSPTPWFYITYQWNSMAGGDMQGTTTTAVTAGVTHANGTNHDIPSRSQCKGCHEEVIPGRVLGFSALSLDFAQTDPTLLDLDDVITLGLVTDQPPGVKSPHFPMPSDATAADIAALGYAHANCGHCHNDTSPIFQGQTQVNFRMDVNKLAKVADTSLFATSIGKNGSVISDDADPNGNCVSFATPAGQPGCNQIVVPDWVTLTAYKVGDRVVKGGNAYIALVAGTSATGPSGTGATIIDGTVTWAFANTQLNRSLLIYRFETGNVGRRMPAAGSEVMDPDGDTILRQWVQGLP